MDPIDRLRDRLAGLDPFRLPPLLEAAVLVPLLAPKVPSSAPKVPSSAPKVPSSADGELSILFERRAEGLPRSAGEVGFPGGRLEPGESPLQAALRELEEELGIGARQVEVLGRLPPLERRRGELIHPVVGLLIGAPELHPDPGEVAEVFQVPLEHFRTHPFRQARIVEEYSLSDDFPRQYLPGGSWKPRVVRPVSYLVHEGQLIWGLSAEILRQLLALLSEEGRE